MIRRLTIFSSTSLHAAVAVQGVFLSMATTGAASRLEIAWCHCGSVGWNVPFAKEPMPCCCHRSSLILRLVFPGRSESFPVMKLLVTSLRLWIVIRRLMKAISGMWFASIVATGASGGLPSGWHFRWPVTSSASVLKALAGSSCRLNRHRMFSFQNPHKLTRSLRHFFI